MFITANLSHIFVVTLFFRQTYKNMVQTSAFSLLIQNWYIENHRDLPWRNTDSPYFIWLSEVILQQTRVVQGLDYYHKFTRLFPTVHDLANASEQEILNTWQGLGYYSRARNLHKTAKHVDQQYNGVFPDSYKELLSLPGVGPYTAAAIASFAYNLPHAVVDGNVFRVLSRVFSVDTPIDSTKGKKEFSELADNLLDKTHPGRHNQAIMELGALVCSPKSPDCSSCPVEEICSARASGNQENFPVKEKKTKVRNRYFHFLLIEEKNKLVIQQRKGKDIWENMYQLPLIETPSSELNIEKSSFSEPVASYSHQLSHQKIHALFYKTPEIPKEVDVSLCRWIEKEELNDLPLPRLIDRFFEEQEQDS